VPEYVHLPLVADEKGKKFSKQQGATGIDYARNPGGLISEALAFLGQNLPPELVGASPLEQLNWATRHFNLPQIPTPPEGFVVV